MWKDLLNSARQLFALVQEVQRLRSEMTEVQNNLGSLREDFKQTSDNVRDIAGGLLHLHNTERLEREKLMLQLENELLKFERRLPPPRDN